MLSLHSSPHTVDCFFRGIWSLSEYFEHLISPHVVMRISFLSERFEDLSEHNLILSEQFQYLSEQLQFLII